VSPAPKRPQVDVSADVPLDVTVDAPEEAPEEAPPRASARTRGQACPACGGRGVVSFGTDDVTCETCDGTGRV
jgi:DnaJ-class molecular chaperone